MAGASRTCPSVVTAVCLTVLKMKGSLIVVYGQAM